MSAEIVNYMLFFMLFAGTVVLWIDNYKNSNKNKVIKESLDKLDNKIKQLEEVSQGLGGRMSAQEKQLAQLAQMPASSGLEPAGRERKDIFSRLEKGESARAIAAGLQMDLEEIRLIEMIHRKRSSAVAKASPAETASKLPAEAE